MVFKKRRFACFSKKELTERILRESKRDYLTPVEQKQIEKEMSRIKHTLESQENYQWKFPEKEKEFIELFQLGFEELSGTESNHSPAVGKTQPKPKGDFVIWGYVILGILFLIAAYFLK